MSPVARPQVQTWCIWYRSQHNGTVFCIAITLGFMHLFLRRWCQWKSYQTPIGKVCGLETIFVFPISEIITKIRKQEIQHVGAGQQESHAAYRWSNGMEQFSTDTLCKNIDRTCHLAKCTLKMTCWKYLNLIMYYTIAVLQFTIRYIHRCPNF